MLEKVVMAVGLEVMLGLDQMMETESADFDLVVDHWSGLARKIELEKVAVEAAAVLVS